MDITARVRDLADKAQQQLPHIQTEEATKLALINPFIREVLGYDTTDLTEVVPEYTADVGVKKGEKVDYAILRDGAPLILIEAKKAGTHLHEEEPNQLYRYFTTTPSAQFGIYTDGIRYLFYSDLEKDNIMDRRPFLILDLLDSDSAPVEEVAKFVKSEFNPEAIRASANELKYTRAIKSELQQEVTNPSEELVKLLMGRVYPGLKTKAKLEQFTAMTRRAARQLIRDELRGTLNTALAQGDPTAAEPDPSETPAADATEARNHHYRGRTQRVLRRKGDLARLSGAAESLRDFKRACAVLLDITSASRSAGSGSTRSRSTLASLMRTRKRRACPSTAWTRYSPTPIP